LLDKYLSAAGHAALKDLSTMCVGDALFGYAYQRSSAWTTRSRAWQTLVPLRQTLCSRCVWSDRQTGETAFLYSSKVRVTVRVGRNTIMREAIGAGVPKPIPIDMPGAAKAEPARRTIPNSAFFICLLLTPKEKASRAPNCISLISSDLRCECLNARRNDGGCLRASWCSAANQNKYSITASRLSTRMKNGKTRIASHAGLSGRKLMNSGNCFVNDGFCSRDYARFRRVGTSGKARSAASAPDPLQARRSSSSRRLFLRL